MAARGISFDTSRVEKSLNENASPNVRVDTRKKQAATPKGSAKRRKAAPEPAPEILAQGVGSKLRVDGAVAARTSGTNNGVCFVELPAGHTYVECEILALESRTQTLALGFCAQMPRLPHLLDKASELDKAVLVGYDLPRVVVDGKETKLKCQWRPLKDLKVGDRLGALLHDGMLLVLVNGQEVVRQAVPWAHRALYGVLDVHGSVTKVRYTGAAPPPACVPRKPATPPKSPEPVVPEGVVPELLPLAGSKLQLDGRVATRTSGVSFAMAFVELPRPFFEVEILQLEKRGSTFALGFCQRLPEAKSMHLLEKATDVATTVMVGYDLPKLVVEGSATKLKGCLWRPLKDLKVGDRVGILYKDRLVTVYVNGEEAVQASVPLLPKQLYGCIDVHGHVAQVKLLDSMIPSRPGAAAAAAAAPKAAAALPPTKRVCLLHKVTATAPKTIPRMLQLTSRLRLGRDPSQADCCFDSVERPNEVSRRHCELLRDGDEVFLLDPGTVNGTFLNDVRIPSQERVPLANGDVITIGGGGGLAAGKKRVQPKSDFRFAVQIE